MFTSYHLIGTPWVVVNGLNPIGGFQSDTVSSEIDKNMGATSIAMLQASLTNASTMTVSVEITNLTMQDIQNARLYAVVYEDTGKSRDRYLVRDVTPATIFTLSGRDTVTYELSPSLTNSSNLHLVVILKTNDDGIIQSQFVK